MFLEEINMTYIEPCLVDNSRIRIKADLSTDISNLLPYLNSYIKTGIYNEKMPNLSYKIEDRVVNLMSNKITIAKLLNETDAYDIMDEIKDLINKVYNNKDNIEPSNKMKKMPGPIEIYKSLPKSNCRKCGELTCMAFAGKLLSGEKTMRSCEPLYDEKNKERRDDLEEIMLLLGYEI